MGYIVLLSAAEHNDRTVQGKLLEQELLTDAELYLSCILKTVTWTA